MTLFFLLTKESQYTDDYIRIHISISKNICITDIDRLQGKGKRKKEKLLLLLEFSISDLKIPLTYRGNDLIFYEY